MPSIQNIPSVTDLIKDDSAIAELDLETIGLVLEDAKALSAAATKVSRALQGEVEERLKDKIRKGYAEAERDTGAVILAEGDLRVEVTRPKKVEWDQTELAKIAERIRAAGDDPAEYLDIEMSMAEKRYVALPASIQRQFASARTVTPGNTSIRIKQGAE